MQIKSLLHTVTTKVDHARVGQQVRQTGHLALTLPGIIETRVDEESKLTLHGPLQYCVKFSEKEKNHKLNDLLDTLEFNQVVIFVKSVQHTFALDKLLVEWVEDIIAIHSGLNHEDHIKEQTFLGVCSWNKILRTMVRYIPGAGSSSTGTSRPTSL